jgi:hypothetical protein
VFFSERSLRSNRAGTLNVPQMHQAHFCHPGFPPAVTLVGTNFLIPLRPISPAQRTLEWPLPISLFSLIHSACPGLFMALFTG